MITEWSENVEFYVGKRREINKGFWISFENHPRLRETKNSIYERCVPCLEKLHNQLQLSPRTLRLKEPLDCWKVVVVVNTVDEALALLEFYQDQHFPVNETVRGRLGTRDSEMPNIAIIFQLHMEKERDKLVKDLNNIAGKVTGNYKIFIERGCRDILVPLCGEWDQWEEITSIEDFSAVPVIKEKVGKLLRGEF